MASVFKRGRWVDAQGKGCRKGEPGARWVKSRFYTIQVVVDGKAKFFKGYSDKSASEQLAIKLERKRDQELSLCNHVCPICRKQRAAKLKQLIKEQSCAVLNNTLDFDCPMCDRRIKFFDNETKLKALPHLFLNLPYNEYIHCQKIYPAHFRTASLCVACLRQVMAEFRKEMRSIKCGRVLIRKYRKVVREVISV